MGNSSPLSSDLEGLHSSSSDSQSEEEESDQLRTTSNDNMEYEKLLYQKSRERIATYKSKFSILSENKKRTNFGRKAAKKIKTTQMKPERGYTFSGTLPVKPD